MFNVINIGLDKGDSGTVDMMNTLVKSTEKNHWMLTAFSKK
jgi:starvation-inducible DNA-binding protein